MKKKKKKEKRARREDGQALLREETPAPEATEESPLQYAVSAVGGKWKMRILWALRSGEPMRYGEIRQQVSGITDMMLSQSLRELSASGLAERRQYQEIPPKVEYRITPAGGGLIPALELMRAWAEKQRKGG